MSFPTIPLPMIVGGIITDNGAPVNGASVSVFNNSGKRLENPQTKEPIMSVTKADGKYAIIYGFNKIPAGVDLDVSVPGKSSMRVKIAPKKGSMGLGVQNIEVSPKTKVNAGAGAGAGAVVTESWIKKNKWVVIGGGVAVVGLIVTMIVLSKKKNK
jgi:hypothetical protein